VRQVPEPLRAPVRRLRGAYREATAAYRGLPSMLLIGAQKAGTTSLFQYLVQHPDVLPSYGKEVHYFDLNYARGERWYRSRFPLMRRLRDGAITLDASPYYLVHPQVPTRAHRLLPDVKLVVLLRNPVDRALSHYQHEVRGGRETLTFAHAVDREPERLAGEVERLERDPTYYSYNHHRYSYLLRGRYVEQLRRWAQHYRRDQMLVIQSERLFREPEAATTAVQEFVGLRPHRIGHYKTFLQGKYERELPPALRERLTAYFAPLNRELYQWLGREFDWA
jgi:hypothetical protein